MFSWLHLSNKQMSQNASGVRRFTAQCDLRSQRDLLKFPCFSFLTPSHFPKSLCLTLELYKGRFGFTSVLHNASAGYRMGFRAGFLGFLARGSWLQTCTQEATEGVIWLFVRSVTLLYF
jgi:hypothetical protein